MTSDDIMREAEKHCALSAGWMFNQPGIIAFWEAAFAAGAEAERNKLATWMMAKGYATGHGDSVADLLKELEWQVREQERNSCAAMVDPVDESLADEIRARGEK